MIDKWIDECSHDVKGELLETQVTKMMISLIT